MYTLYDKAGHSLGEADDLEYAREVMDDFPGGRIVDEDTGEEVEADGE